MAKKKISAQTVVTTHAITDMLPIIKDPATVPLSRIISINNFLTTCVTVTASGTISAHAFSNPNPGVSLANNNEAFGSGALDAVATGGNNNTACGKNALTALNSGDNNCAFGYSALASVTSGIDNFGLGVSAGGSLTTGSYNICFGQNSIVYSVSGSKCIAIGFGAGFGAAGLSNLEKCILIGYEAGNALRSAAVSTIAIGDWALKVCQDGLVNLAIGLESQMYNVSADENTTVGNHSGVYLVDGSGNSYYGYSSGACQTSGARNSGFGRHAIYGSYNAALTPKADPSVSVDNVGFGYHALKNICGVSAGQGSQNTCLGSGCGEDLTIGSNNILIGFGIEAAAVDTNDSLNIGGLITGTQSAVAANKRLGLFDATPVARVVLATGVGHTVDDVITMLQNLGACKQA